jgi:GNAT superfamily N-acetyltransferase
MVRDDLLTLPLPEPLPEGYALRAYQPGDDQAWTAILAASFQADPARFDFDAIMRNDPSFRPHRLLFIRFGEQPVAVSGAFYHPAKMKHGGMIHYVGVLPGHQGKNLGYHVCLACLHQMKKEGRTGAILSTDDFRLPAIKTYLKLGFRPHVVHDNQRSRWPAVFEKLGQPGLAETFAAFLSEPAHPWPLPTVPDQFDYAGRIRPRLRRYPRRPDSTPFPRDLVSRADESLYHALRLGSASCSVTEVDAGETRPFELRFTAGPDFPAVSGAEVRFHIHGQGTLGGPIQWQAPGQPGYQEFPDPPAGVTLEPLPLGFRIARGPLAPGQTVRIRVGRDGGFAWTPLAGRLDLHVLILPGHREPLLALPAPVAIRVRPLAPERLEVLLPAGAQPGAPVRATLSLRDRYDNRVPVDAPVKVRLPGAARTAYLSQGLGVLSFPMPEKAFRLKARAAGLAGRSNPCLPASGRACYFGDLHAHDNTCEASGYAHEAFRWAAEEKRLDFLALALQSHNWCDNQKWAVLKQQAEAWLEEGRFVTFPSCEWQHSHYGDKIIHFTHGNPPYLPTDDKGASLHHPPTLYEAVRAADAFIVSHHPGYPLDQHVPGTDFNAIETDVERLVELWSMHGSSEGVDPADRPLRAVRSDDRVLDALRRGLRLGFTAGSDTHTSRPGGSAHEPRAYWGGLCGVWASALTRAGLFEAFMARRTVALTGARIVLRFTVNGEPMGSEQALAPKRACAIEAWGTDTIARVELWKNGEPRKTWTPGRETCRLSFTDRDPAPAFYHIRLIQADGHLAVCSPAWVG